MNENDWKDTNWEVCLSVPVKRRLVLFKVSFGITCGLW